VFGGNVALLIGSGLLMQFFLFGMWAVLYTYTPELYPTSARATGSGFASAIGRVGSLLGPLVTGLVFPITGQGGVFALGALCFAIAALVVWLFGMETRGKTLEELTESTPVSSEPAREMSDNQTVTDEPSRAGAPTLVCGFYGFTRRASRLFCARRLAWSWVMPRWSCSAWKFSVT
jgi:MFS family permease